MSDDETSTLEAGTQYVESSGGMPSIKWDNLLSLIASSLILFVTSLWMAIVETGLNLQLWVIRHGGGAVIDWYRSLMTDSAGIVDDSWTAAGNSIEPFGFLAPWIAVTVVISLVTLIVIGREVVL